MHWSLKVLALVVLATAAGLVSAFWVVTGALERGQIRNGPWSSTLLIGNVDADPMTRAAVAYGGLLALNAEETVYFSARSDSAGESLRAGCAYTITGTDLPARWWSMTVYGADQFLIPNEANRYAFGSTQVLAAPGSTFTVHLATQETAAPWLALPEAGPFSLTVRLYNPDPSALEDLTALPLPTITKGECRS